MTSIDLASLLLKEVSEYLRSVTYYLEDADKALSINNTDWCSKALHEAEKCRDIAKALHEAAKLLMK